jgi:hypothetical protein
MPAFLLRHVAVDSMRVHRLAANAKLRPSVADAITPANKL